MLQYQSGEEIYHQEDTLWVDLRLKQRKKSKETYDGQVKAALANVWEIFDYLL